MAMHCELTENRLHELLDSRRAVDSDEALCEHLESCPECAELAAAYAALARGEHATWPTAPIEGLADRVRAEVNQARSLQRPALRAWSTWTTLAVAASLLIAVGLAIQNDAPPVEAPKPAPPTLANGGSPAANDEQHLVAQQIPVHRVAGGEVWYQTGRGLATITLAGMRSTDRATMEADASVEPPLFRRAYDTLRQMWDPQGDAQPTGGETGWLHPDTPLAVV